jgi:hypothetical protein
MSKKYAKLPAKCDPRLKYLVSVMLRKNLETRFNLDELLGLDFLNKHVCEVIVKNGWENKIEGIEEIFHKEKIPFYKFLSGEILDSIS